LPTARMGIPGTGVVVSMTEGVHFELALALLALAVLAFAAVSRGPAGLALAAAREGRSQAAALGIDRSRLHLGAFVASAAIGGLAGALSVQLAGVADPSAYGPLLSSELFVAVLLGGEGRVLGPAVGAGLLVLIPGAARGLGSFPGVGLARYEPVLAAVLLVVGLLLGRGGVVRILERAFRSIGLRPHRSDSSVAPLPAGAAAVPRGGPAELRARGLSRRFGGV